MNEFPPTPAFSGQTTGGARARARLVIRGAVQGVGFRPFLYRLARELDLAGWVSNSASGVVVEVEGPAAAVRTFALRVEPERPPRSFIESLETTILDPVGLAGFTIRPSDPTGEQTALILPDIATCADCVRELFEPRDRRFGYPFINCTHCGPRFSIIEALPYDRAHTTMRGFPMCPACQTEYADPANRRFHAQPNACPVCGPQLAFWDTGGRLLAGRNDALRAGVEALLAGRILAVKGLGGFHLMTLATDEPAVRRLRARKHREEKPLALMAPSLAWVKRLCAVNAQEERLLLSPEAPIVLLRRRAEEPIARSIAPGNPHLGVMLPYTPLHHLLLAALNQPVVATSGNLSDEPICTDERDALKRLGGIADGFLVHDRPIVRPVDDSIARVVLDRETVLRRARGYAPLPIQIRDAVPAVLAVGAHLKNTIALGRDHHVFLSQHLGDLETPAALAAFERTITDLSQLLAMKPTTCAADLHPDYLSSRHARQTQKRVICVQHHYAHVLACMAENDVAAPLLGVSWDGTGYGTDDTVWGGEFLVVDESHFERVAHLRPFRLPGGEAAVREPRRIALGLLHSVLGEAAFALKTLPTLQAFRPAELKALWRMLERGVNSPITTSAGRLFDAVASLTGLRQETRFEGQAAMDLEFALEADDTDESYSLPVRGTTREAAAGGQAIAPRALHRECQTLTATAPRWLVDWAPMVERIVRDVQAGVPAWLVSARFHNGLAGAVLAVAREAGQRRVVLSGGCFQNRYLIERTVQRLHDGGFSAYWHQRVPPNDGGIALGQVVAAGRELRKTRS